MSASARSDGDRMHTFDSEEIPPPMPLSCRPFGSGLPIAARKIGSHSARSGRSRAWNITARLVPPRMNTAGMASCGMDASLAWRSREPFDVASAGAQRRGAADWVDDVAADHQIDVGAVRTERIVTGQIKLGTCLPPAVLRRHDAVGEIAHQACPRAYPPIRRGDRHPIVSPDAARGGGVRAQLDHRFGKQLAQ